MQIKVGELADDVKIVAHPPSHCGSATAGKEGHGGMPQSDTERATSLRAEAWVCAMARSRAYARRFGRQ